MPYPRPPLTSLIARARQAVQAELQDSDPTLRRSFLRALTTAQAALDHGQYGAQQWTTNQIIVLYCDADTLADQAQIYQLPQLDGTYAGGSMVVTGTNGTDIPAGTEVVASNGKLYTTNADATPSGGTVTIALTAEEVGADGNQDANAVLTFTTPINGINATASVASGGLTGGADVEAIDDWRQRLLQRIGNPPGRWLTQDYVDFVEGLFPNCRAWGFPNELSTGMMSVRFVIDDGSGTASILPTTGQVTTVQTALNTSTPALMPATAVAPIADVVNFTIHSTPAAYQAAVKAELAALFSNANASGATLPLTEIVNAINQAVPAGTDWTLTAPSADVVPASNGYIPTLGTVSFT